MTNLQKNLFECSNRDAIASDLQFGEILVETFEELGKFTVVLMRNL